MNLPKLRAYNGFSLIELMIVIAIIGLIGGIGASFASSVQRNTRDAQRQSDLQILQSAIQQFYADMNHYPNSLTLSGGAVLTNCSGEPAGCATSKTYLSKTPKDPTGAVNYCYTSFVSVSNQSTFCTSANQGQCHFYELCARPENPPSTATGICSCMSGSTNFRVTPL